jgi:hypothetical protein
MTNPITPPPELVQQWEDQFLERPTINGCFIQSYIAAKAAQWGADQELEACCETLDMVNGSEYWSQVLRSGRRPKPPSLAQRALHILGTHGDLSCAEHDTIRRALEALDD